MIELQIINKVLKDKSINLLMNNNIGPEHFSTYGDEFLFIAKHYATYGMVPDVETFLDAFHDFEVIDVQESDKYLISRLNEDYLTRTMIPSLYKIRDLIEEEKGDEALKFALGAFRDIQEITTYKAGYDIVKNAGERHVEYQNRTNLNGLLGISTGSQELDEILHGWLPGEDFISIVGRTNEGKSWILMYFLVTAWKAGNPVVMYSGEMSELMCGFRFDTLNAHFKNDGLMTGKKVLGTSDNPLSDGDYDVYTQNLSCNETPFIIVRPKHLGGKQLDIPALEALITAYKPKIVGIDQLSLMRDYRAKSGDLPRTRYTHLAEDIYNTSEKFGIPIMSPSQASREAAKDGKKTEASPELDQISESDGVGQNATRVISIKQLANSLKMSIKKNRYGKNNIDMLFAWDIDYGILRPMVIESEGGSGDSGGQLEGTDAF